MKQCTVCQTTCEDPYTIQCSKCGKYVCYNFYCSGVWDNNDIKTAKCLQCLFNTWTGSDNNEPPVVTMMRDTIKAIKIDPDNKDANMVRALLASMLYGPISDVQEAKIVAQMFITEGRK